MKIACLYADDLVLFGESEEDLKVMGEHFVGVYERSESDWK